jgi:gliding motility-associated-like protein
LHKNEKGNDRYNLARVMSKKILVQIILSFLLFSNLYGQIDSEFWFAAPEVTNQHGDRPIFINVSSFNTKATVTISQPANSGFTPIVIKLPPNTTKAIDLTPFIDMIETQPGNTILNTGLLVRSTTDITAYYEVRGGDYSYPHNSDLFSLKGSNALGTKFFIPMQTEWANAPFLNAWASFDIIATENNTTVTIIPSNDVVGHTAGIPYTVVLNKGETYSALATSIVAGAHLTGSYVTSDKLIAITIKDDSVKPPSGGWELIGDQIIPVSIIGTQYIVVRGLSSGLDRVFIVGVKNNTDIFIDGSSIPIATIDSGQSYSYTVTNPSSYIQSSNPVYAFHVTGFDTELGGAILPPIGCTGSKKISLTRSLPTAFYLILLVENGGENNFLINGQTGIDGSLFAPVPGTGGAWLSQLVVYDNSIFPVVGAPLTISNTSKSFHLGVINETGATGPTGCMYGFFSDFGGLELGPEIITCDNQNILLNAGLGKDSYLWSTGETTQSITITSPTPGVVFHDTITVAAQKGVCTFVDTIFVTISPSPIIPFPSDTSMCKGDSIRLIGSNGMFTNTYLWNNNSTDSFLIVKKAGSYSLTVKNNFGCESKKTCEVKIIKVHLDLGQDTTICSNDKIVLNAGPGQDTYLWGTGDTTQKITIVSPDPTTVFIDTISIVTTKKACVHSDSIVVTINPSPVFSLPTDTATCIGDSIVLRGGPGFISYLWDNGNTDSILVTKKTADHWLKVENNYGCKLKQFSSVTFINSTLDLGPDIIACSNDDIRLDAGDGKDTYLWSTGSVKQQINIKTPDSSIVYQNLFSVVTSKGVCVLHDTVMVTINPSPVITTLPPKSTICIHDSVRLSGGSAFVNYTWNTGSTDSFIVAKKAGQYWVRVENNYACKVKKITTLITIDSPSVHLRLGPDKMVCKDATTLIDAGSGYNSYLWQDGSKKSIYAATQAGTYYVTVTNICGAATDTIKLSYWNIFIPNLFTPNTDGHNDTFWINGIEQGAWRFSVYNRWGEKVYFANEYDNTWDGKELSDGIYYYYLEEDSDCNKFKGWVQIQR